MMIGEDMAWFPDYTLADRPEGGTLLDLDKLWPGLGVIVIYPPQEKN